MSIPQHTVIHEVQEHMTCYQWVLAFSMTIENIKDLHAKIADDLQCNPVKACN